MRIHKRNLGRHLRDQTAGYVQRIRRMPRLHLVLVGVGCAALAMGLMPAPRPAAEGAAPFTDSITFGPGGRHGERVTLPLELPRMQPEELPDLVPEMIASVPQLHQESGVSDEGAVQLVDNSATDLKRRFVTVARGDTLSSIFATLGIPQAELHRMLEAGEGTKALSRLYQGQELEIVLNPEKRVVELTLSVDATHSLQLVESEDGFRMQRLDAELDRRMATATGRITNSLFLAAKDAGLSDSLIMEMVDIFAWDVDFALDIREGDRFVVIYEEIYKSAEKLDDGNILAAEFTNRGRAVRAIRYTDGEGHTAYYTPEGRSLRKAFLRTPVKYSHISSRFTPRRWHPVLHRFRAHRGVDYAAPSGTPVKATGDGTVTLVGRQGGYGRTVMIQHGEKYTTLYAHLSRYARGLKPKKRVLQGQLIGYVGSSGLASGPHLHYEFRVNGEHRDPLKVALPKSAPIAPQHRAEFLAHSQAILAQLDLLAEVAVARTSD